LAPFGAALGGAPSVSAECHAFARRVAFAERGAVPLLFLASLYFLWRLAGVLFTVAAGAFRDPAFVSRLAYRLFCDLGPPALSGLDAISSAAIYPKGAILFSKARSLVAFL
jgi:hypothetical protein